MLINAENYHSHEANLNYKSSSQVKQAMNCAACWYAQRKGEYKRPETDALLHGSYVDIALTEPGKMTEFIYDNYDKLHKKDSKKDVENGVRKHNKLQSVTDLDLAISRAQRDPLFMSYLQGEFQEIIVLENFRGHAFRCKLDVLKFPGSIDESGREVDLKTCKDLDGEEWTKPSDGKWCKIGWIYHWGYHMQRALYREAIWLEHKFHPDSFIAAIEKGKTPDIRVFEFDYATQIWGAIVDQAVAVMDMMDMVVSEDIEAKRCESCDYCKQTRVLKNTVSVEFDNRVLSF